MIRLDEAEVRDSEMQTDHVETEQKPVSLKELSHNEVAKSSEQLVPSVKELS